MCGNLIMKELGVRTDHSVVKLVGSATRRAQLQCGITRLDYADCSIDDSKHKRSQAHEHSGRP